MIHIMVEDAALKSEYMRRIPILMDLVNHASHFEPFQLLTSMGD